MAYLKPIHERFCYIAGCKKRAVVTLCNHCNAELRDYCQKHGKAALVALKLTEGQVSSDG